MAKRQIGQRRFQQALQIGDVICLLNTSGFLTDASAETPFYEVTMAESIPFVGKHGLLLLYSEGAVPAGYALDPNGVTGAVTAGASVTVQPAALQLNRGQLFQFRVRMKVLATLGVAVQDIDLTASLPASVQRWRVGATTAGVLNAVGQVQDPSDQIVMPAQAANETLPAAFPSEDAWDAAWRTELWTYYDQNPQFTITNNGSGSTSGGGIGLQVAGVLYNVTPIPGGSNPGTGRLAGYTAAVPAGLDIRNDVSIIPVAGRSTY